MPGESSEFKLRTLQWLIIGLWMVLFAITFYLEWEKPDDKRTPMGCAMGFATALAHGLWITIDLKIQNRPVGGWRFAAFFLGPFAIWAYLLQTYRIRALWMIPLSLVIYVFPSLIVAVAVSAFHPQA